MSTAPYAMVFIPPTKLRLRSGFFCKRQYSSNVLNHLRHQSLGNQMEGDVHRINAWHCIQCCRRIRYHNHRVERILGGRLFGYAF
jgi:hypothetical protein